MLKLPKIVKYSLARHHYKGDKNVKIAFQTLPKGKNPPNGYHYVNCNMVFGIKMDDFHRKVCPVVGGHVTLTWDTITYSSVVTRETVHIVHTMAEFHALEVKAVDVLNAYVTAPSREKIWTGLDSEVGDNAGKSAIIVRALYGQ